ncbi:hypothetical protein K505DRAFT_329534 [Melanomma pulvis-pyrius CBS 109.77]|uniref:Uncharacterized protein n=1 Tax=Melanomma pulvis-pyrius CBS 109.77 TaxID=1314802 RepID=A0A6A6WUS5_9PLEO|nr:hypothetical protein K505DRAFT_329534 [Melanomma pulvis-pyrius CBS 109.77]
MNWLTRKAIGLATVTQTLTSYEETTPAGPITHIDIDQTATGGLKGTSEKRTLDWTARPHSDYLFGDLMAKSRWSSLATILADNVGTGKPAYIEDDARYLVEGWLPETAEGDVVENFVENEKAGWTGWQVWGFAEVESEGAKERWLVRRFVIRKGEKVERVRLVYAWAGEA